MSNPLIQQYRAQVEKLIRYSGSRNESVLRKAFQELLDHYARRKNLLLVPEVEFITPKGHKVYPDGTLKDALRQNWGFWESKDEKDNLNDEIIAKFAKGYPDFNILFEDTQNAVLYQNGELVMSASFADDTLLDNILTLFASYEPLEVREFHKAIEQFVADVPELAITLREILNDQYESNQVFKKSLCEFLELCRKSINPKIEIEDVREMIIQHILTEDIFMRVFDEVEFHRENVIAQKLQEVAGTFYRGNTKRSIDARIAPYYVTINARASQISDHHEKQKFLKALYENFYKAYNPKAADRLGVIYTPDEIVRFMILGTEYLLSKHFNKTIGDSNVDILDPATGTGTFITEIIEYLPLEQLERKYATEIHCNEVAILPYYIANLNIEFTYKQKTGKYKEFENICFVDTLDNLGFDRLGKQQLDFFGLFDENAERIGKQNSRRISVVIGNPPYNAWQENYNNQNANREYPGIDKRIKETYIKNGTAQNQNAIYDMYTRFLRWASDRLAANGIIAFVSNNSFIDSRSYDGFRKVIGKEFNDIYIIDLKGNARTSGERRKREGGNVFNNQIKVGIAIYFMVRNENHKGFRIFYNPIQDYVTSQGKLNYLSENQLSDIKFTNLLPDYKGNWLNASGSDWNDLIPLSRETKSIFSISSNGIKTQRDEWVYDFSQTSLINKMHFFIDLYQKVLEDNDYPDKFLIKWDYDLEKHLNRKLAIEFSNEAIVDSLYRPYVKTKLYFDKRVNGRIYQLPKIFPKGNGENKVICISGIASSKPFHCLLTNIVPCLDLLEKTQCFPLKDYSVSTGNNENITDWALLKFQKHYKDKRITKESIFHYIYSVLHYPEYRAKYEINLKRDFPRIPFYDNFWKWVDWGKSLADLHLNFESVQPYELERFDKNPDTIRKINSPRLKACKEVGSIEIDSTTILSGIPSEAWNYLLGTYSALEWVLERYKARNPKDSTIREKFNTYNFADYKEQVIDLLKRVCTVSVETMKIIAQMPISK